MASNLAATIVHKSRAAEFAAVQTLREYEGGWEEAEPLECAAFPRFGLAVCRKLCSLRAVKTAT
jgi:hypothetical protein